MTGGKPELNLLFGLFALQNGLIDQAALVVAFQSWTCDRSRLLADHLVERGALDGADRATIDRLVECHLKRHGGDVERSLDFHPLGSAFRNSLSGEAGHDVEATLAQISASLSLTEARVEGDLTTTHAVLTAASQSRYAVLRPHAKKSALQWIRN